MFSSIKEKAIALILHKNSNYALVFLIFACLIFYVYFANAAVRTLTVLENSKREVQSLSVEVSELESKRLLVDHGLGNTLATRMGFVEVKDQTFIVNKAKKAALSFKAN